jgi:hypothetical protein
MLATTATSAISKSANDFKDLIKRLLLTLLIPFTFFSLNRSYLDFSCESVACATGT